MRSLFPVGQSGLDRGIRTAMDVRNNSVLVSVLRCHYVAPIERAMSGCLAAQVWRALCLPYNEEVAVKMLDLENVNCSLVRTLGCTMAVLTDLSL